VVRESDVEEYFVTRVKNLGGEVRKVAWIGRAGAPDRLVGVPPQKHGGIQALIEMKSPDTIGTFPADARERAQAREHVRLRAAGFRVEVIGTFDQVDAFLATA
jgi:hypothetical protein